MDLVSVARGSHATWWILQVQLLNWVSHLSVVFLQVRSSTHTAILGECVDYFSLASASYLAQWTWCFPHNTWATFDLYNPWAVAMGAPGSRSPSPCSQLCELVSLSCYWSSKVTLLAFVNFNFTNVISSYCVCSEEGFSQSMNAQSPILPRTFRIYVFSWTNYSIIIFLSSSVICEWLEQASPSLCFKSSLWFWQK